MKKYLTIMVVLASKSAFGSADSMLDKREAGAQDAVNSFKKYGVESC